MEPAAEPPVRVPQALDRLRPAGDLLDLVECENEASLRAVGLYSGTLPLAHQPPLVPVPSARNGGHIPNCERVFVGDGRGA